MILERHGNYFFEHGAPRTYGNARAPLRDARHSFCEACQIADTDAPPLCPRCGQAMPVLSAAEIFLGAKK